MKTLRELQEGAATAEEQKFWYRVHEIGDCWFFGIGDPFRYGSFYWKGAAQLAHRVSYALTKGEIPTDHVIRHACDTPRCVRPEHLDAGTQKENMADVITRERGRFGKNRSAWNPTKKSIYVLRLPKELRSMLDTSASLHRRSVHGEILHILEQYIQREASK